MIRKGRFTSKGMLAMKSDEGAKVVLSPAKCLEESNSVSPPSVEPFNKNILALLLVPVVWGTYSPLVKGMYSTAGVLAPPGLLFNLASYSVSLFTLTSASKLFLGYQPTRGKGGGEEDEEKFVSNIPFSFANKNEWRAGIELGLWLFLGSSLQVMGIQHTTATRAAILVQLTTVMVPLLESLFNQKSVSLQLWISCLLALVGVVFVSVENPVAMLNDLFTGATTSPSLVFDVPNSGDLLVVAASLFYSMHVVRLGRVAGQVRPISLARVKSFTELCASILVALSLTLFAFANGTTTTNYSFSRELFEYVQAAWKDPVGTRQGFVLLCVLWNGAMATALTTWAQTFGQKAVSSTSANLFYSSQPIWAALFSYLFLGDRLSDSSLVGVSFLTTAILLAIYNNNTNSENT